jgi:uncharacterized protein (PEP-CTERM system associated)
VLGAILLSPLAAKAGDWNITPRISLAGIYSDNVDLEPDNEQTSYITEVSPGISVRGIAGRFQANIDYQMENFFSSQNNYSPNTNHQLVAGTTTELAKDLFFLDANARAGQTILDNSRTLSQDNYTDNRNRTDFITYTLSPYITPHFGTFADASLRYSYDDVLYRKGDASDSTTHRVGASINNGRWFSLLTWAGNYNYRKESRSGSASDVEYEEANGNARFRLTRYFSLVGEAGRTNDFFATNEGVDNGSYWSVGGFWQHSRYWSLEAQKGHNQKTATLGLFPTRRTELVINYRDRDVGRNPGEVWTGRFSHYTRRSSWSATYIEDTTTSQQRRLEEQGGFLLVDPVTGEPNPDPQPGDVVVNVPLGPTSTLTDEVEERKRGEGTVGFNTGKSGLRATIFYEQTRFLESLQEEETRGISGSWNWRFAPATSSILTGSWRRNTGNDRDDNDYWYVQALVQRQITTDLTGSLSYRHQREVSDDDDNDYEENSVIARLTATF